MVIKVITDTLDTVIAAAGEWPSAEIGEIAAAASSPPPRSATDFRDHSIRSLALSSSTALVGVGQPLRTSTKPKEGMVNSSLIFGSVSTRSVHIFSPARRCPDCRQVGHIPLNPELFCN